MSKPNNSEVAAELAGEALPSSKVKTSSRPLLPDLTRPTFPTFPPSPPSSPTPLRRLLFPRDRHGPLDPRSPLITNTDNATPNPPPIMPESSIKRSLGVSLTRTIQESRVLLVGAGGIGCELLKNLVLTGFGEIHIIDLDTIDLSNLNRQFLFRHEHIKKPKALVAKEVAHKFQPKAKLEAYHANVMDKRFNVEWFQSFNIVFNALDNLAARRHVNHMCLAASVPLIESGTTGFNGQVQVIEKVGRNDRETIWFKERIMADSSRERLSATIAIRKRPPKRILSVQSEAPPPNQSTAFELFGESEDTETLDNSTTADNADEIAKLKQQARQLQEIRDSMGSEEFPHKVFDKVFRLDIEELGAMEGMWKERKAPEALVWDDLQEQSKSVEPTIAEIDQREWTLPEAFFVFKDSLVRLSKRLKELQKTSSPESPPPVLEFDKDDTDTLDFVTATAILRAAIFGIESRSKFDTKQMAGNIIPAIATTNAMTAGLCVLQAFKVLQNDLANSKMVFLERSGARAINSDSLNPPRPDCGVCSAVHGHVIIDPEQATLNDVVEGVLQSELGYSEEFSILKESGVIYDPDLEDNLPKKLSELGITNGTWITVMDEDDQDKVPRVNLELFFIERTEKATEEDKPAQLKQLVEIPRRAKPTTEALSEDTLLENGTTSTGKRKREGEDDDLTNGHIAKKVAGESSSDDNEPIVIEDEGAITIDD
ncbi:ubiquitin-like activating enzyme [Penicillium verhagenii]|uniref:ubiquitin-like activating enzyme n=1 Tax=Penicillium verhagenii TaxID=1562060 RepID=UPI0025453E4B|nr:ubiquitin-like activating enzyme [Penicillium verhagenii]KAJ5918518.1 ubiquitin-like activating enzyme [Penicillium verhagenii]